MRLFRSPLSWFFIIVLILDLFVYFFISRKNYKTAPDFSQQAYSKIPENVEIDDAYYWKYIAENSNPDSKLASGTWNVSLEGDVLPEDSIHLQQLLTELNELMDRVHFNFTSDSGKYNLNLAIYHKTEFNKTKRTYYIMGSGRSFTPRDKIEMHIDYVFSDQLRQEERNNIMKFYVVHSLIDFYDISNKKSNIILPRKNGSSARSIDPTKYTLPLNDEKFLSMLYADHFHFELFKSSPFYLFTYLHRINEEKFSFTVRIIVYLMIIVYFLLSYRLKFLDEALTGRKGFHRNTHTTVIGFGLLVFLLQLAYWNNVGHWSILVLHVFNLMLIALLAIHLLGYTERKLIKEEFSDLKKMMFRVFISLVFLLLAAIIPFLPGEILGDVFLYFAAIIVGRTIIDLQKIRIKHAVGEKELQLANLQKLQHQTELQAIQSRINPHFLYNSLNSIASLTRMDPEKAEEMALSLSDYFRYSINKQNKKMTPLKDELESVKTYLNIEKIRFSNQLEYSVHCDQQLFDYYIPRFLIQPLVENAIKHGTSEITEKGIVTLEITRQDAQLIIKVSDNGKDFSEDPIPGFGLQSIFDKLELIYHGEANMNWSYHPDKAIIITLPYSSQ